MEIKLSKNVVRSAMHKLVQIQSSILMYEENRNAVLQARHCPLFWLD